MTLCYRCGVGKNVTEQKVANQSKLEQQFEHLPVNSPAPRIAKKFDVLPEKKSKPKKRRIVPCIHRGKYVGTLDCACDGARDTYRCTKIDRPGHAGEKVFCIEVLTSKSYSKILDPKTKKILHRIDDGEVILCQEPHTVEMNGGKHPVGCSMYASVQRAED